MTKRRTILKSLLALPLLKLPQTVSGENAGENSTKIIRSGSDKIKISLNAYSFNSALRSGQISLNELLEFCAEHNFDGLDITAYYFPGYPQTPDDNMLYQFKRKAYHLGLDISGTGIKNDFSDPDRNIRKDYVMLIKNWTDTAVRLGAPVLRVFAGKQEPAGYTRTQIFNWIVEDLKECVAYGAKNGIIIAIQNHNEFLKTADQTIEILEAVDSSWFGLVLDIGSLRSGDPYEDISRLAPFAVNWQIKEFVYRHGKQEKTDVKKIVDILREIGYRGYIPIEILGAGNPKIKIQQFLAEIRSALA